MATIADLNIRIGADISQLKKEMRAAERTLKASGENLTNIGRSMAFSITAPLIGLGAVAIKSAGEMESLRLAMRSTFETAGRSIAEADAELEALRKSALAPGLDFEQAVKASIRLQGVGMNAAKARETVEQLANAVAMTGGSAEDLGEVTNQFSQMIGKGKILNEDLKIITSRMPKLSGLMKEAFGSTQAEAIRDAGISAAEFVDIMTAKMKELPRVEGGISNSFVNLGSSIRQAMVAIGDDLSKSLNLKETIGNLSNTIDGLVYSFKALSPETKQLIVNLALTAAAAGPAIYGLGLLLKTSAALKVATLAMYGGLGDLAVGLGKAAAWAAKARLAFLDLSLATQAGALGLIAVAIGIAAAAFAEYSREMTTAEKVTKALNDVTKEAENTTTGERLEVERLIATAKNEAVSKETRIRAINELKRISPEYFGQLSTEKINVDALTGAYSGYIKNLLASARAKAAEQKLIAIDQQLQDEYAKKRAKLSEGEKGGAAMLGMNEAQAIAAINREIDKNVESLTAQRTALEGVVSARLSETLSADAAGTAAEDAARRAKIAAEEEKKKAEERQKEQDKADRKRNKAAKEKEAELKAETDAWEALTEGRAAYEEIEAAAALRAERKNAKDAAAIQSINVSKARDFSAKGAYDMTGNNGLPTAADMTIPDEAISSVGRMAEAQNGLARSMQNVGRTIENVINLQQAQTDITNSVANSIMQLSEAGVVSFKKFGQAALYSAVQVAKAKMVEGIFSAVSSALSTIPFPFNLAAAGLAAGGAAALLNGLTNRIKPPALAQGGLAYGPTLATVGDNPGARSNPEVIAPLDKLQRIMGDVGGGMLSTSVRGDDLLILLERAQNRRTRSRGY